MLSAAMGSMTFQEACSLWATTSPIDTAADPPDAGNALRRIYHTVASALPLTEAHTARYDMFEATLQLLQTLQTELPRSTTHTRSTDAADLDSLEAHTADAESAAQRYREAHESLAAHVQEALEQEGGSGRVSQALLDARDNARLKFHETLQELTALRETVKDSVMSQAKPPRQSRLDAAAAALTAALGVSPFEGEQEAELPADSDSDNQACAAALKQLETVLRHAKYATIRLRERCQSMVDCTVKRDAKGMVRSLEAVQLELRTLMSLRPSDDQSFYDMIKGLAWPAVIRCFHRQRTPLATLSSKLETLAARRAALVDIGAAISAAEARKADVVAAFEKEYKALKKARKLYITSMVQEDSSDDESADAVAAQLAEQRLACRSAARSRDAAARTLCACARAFYPEILLQQSKRLGKGANLAAWSERQLQDYEDRMPLPRAEGGRHLIIKAVYDGKPCVLKVLPFRAASFIGKEVDVLRRLDHPNIVRLEAVFSGNDHIYMHLPFASHGDLEQFLSSEASLDEISRVPPAALCKMSWQLCEALAYLAERGVVHCDVKPANIFIDGDKRGQSLRAILGDFDVSHTASGRTSTLTLALQTRAVATHFSAGYAAPEVACAAAGAPPRATHKLDVFGLGCVIYHMHMYPRALREATSLEDELAATEGVFDVHAAGLPAPRSNAWAQATPIDVIGSATKATASARLSARELLQAAYMRRGSGDDAEMAVQRPAYWKYQEHAGSWQVRESEDVRAAVEQLMNATAVPDTHGQGRDSHAVAFQRFRVVAVHRIENPSAWLAFASQRRALAQGLAAEGYALPRAAQALATAGFVYPLAGGSFDGAAGEVALFHGTAAANSIASAGFDVRYAFARRGAGAAFGRGVYFAESSSKADQYVQAGSDGRLCMFLSRVCLGRCALVSRLRGAAPFLPEVKGASTPEVPVYYDSILADVEGMRFREIVVGRDASAYPELMVEYERVL